MIRSLLALTIAAVSAFAGGTSSASEPASDAAVAPPSLEKIADGVWIHKSHKIVEPYGPVLSQGLVVKTGGGVILVDTAWNAEDTEALLGAIADTVGGRPQLAVVTHAHEDKMGGMAALAHVDTAAFELTNADAPARGLLPAKISLSRGTIDKPLSVRLVGPNGEVAAQGEVEIFYPGPGHTRDNIVVYYAPAKVLFGGCLIRPADAANLGNTADADIANWANAARAVAARFPDAEIVIPSHGPRGGRELLDHTIALAEAAAKNAQ